MEYKEQTDKMKKPDENQCIDREQSSGYQRRGWGVKLVSVIDCVEMGGNQSFAGEYAVATQK